MLLYSLTTIAISLALSIRLTETDQMFAFYLLPCRAWELGLGGLVAILLHDDVVEWLRVRITRFAVFRVEWVVRAVLEVVGWLGLFMAVYSYVLYNKRDDLFPGYKAMLPCFGIVLYILANVNRYK